MDVSDTLMTAAMLAPQDMEEITNLLKEANLSLDDFRDLCNSWEKAMEWAESKSGPGAHFGSGFVAGLAWARKEKELPEVIEGRIEDD